MSLFPPLLLSIDCCDPRTVVGLVWGDQVVAMAETPAEVRSAISLVPTIRSLYQTAALRYEQIIAPHIPELQKQNARKPLGFGDTRVVAVTYGPGSFTSLRIGLTVAKTLAYSHRLPLLGINSLDVLLAASRTTCLHQQSSGFSAESCSNSQTIHDDNQPVQPKLAWATKVAYRGLYYHKAVLFKGERVSSPPNEVLNDRIAAYLSSQKQGLFHSPDSERSLSTWACSQPEASETAVPERADSVFWQTISTTQMNSIGDLRAQLNQGHNSTPMLIVGDLGADLAAMKDSAVHLPNPTPDQRVAAMSQLAWQTLATTPLELWNPMLVQPTYYRVSAAEEATR
ncbi:MAG: tRNA (adenosine(37)-N6)-threonylcarbamoyltransferase complex dimerization subunit type 1 TsaB [Planctomycetaceae bacterium]|nr:tRNA (adenosine(37)-N6)-threonylcarbamoyltransferase complex dimerization subunit type 1 TsaB [Planctomycetaceae bacterium]